uniref:Secreted protein n=1 Tax=Echinococcus granulosus TaxID=6210 RepID=A0A068WWC2_ECHGR|nr:hypothetical protein EgrG_000073100 [Echinococcus granulosus]
MLLHPIVTPMAWNGNLSPRGVDSSIPGRAGKVMPCTCRVSGWLISVLSRLTSLYTTYESVFPTVFWKAFKDCISSTCQLKNFRTAKGKNTDQGGKWQDLFNNTMRKPKAENPRQGRNTIEVEEANR